MLNFNKNIFEWNKLTIQQKSQLLLRPLLNKKDNIKYIVKKIIKDIKKYGDTALKKYTLEFDYVNLTDFFISNDQLIQASNNVSDTFKKAILIAYNNIKKFHKFQIVKNLDVKISSGVRCQRIVTPIQSVGLYVPGGLTPLVSTVLMLSIPAVLAGCPEIILCSPPPIKNEILYVANMCGIKKILQLGGAQAIAALACGTKTINKVDKIFGPGNMFVTEAKMQVNNMFSNISIDMPAGPSEVLIIADLTSDPKFIASDLLAQAEHDYNAHVILLTPFANLASNVCIQLNQQIKNLSRKKFLIKSCKNSKIIITKNLEECFTISNQYAPEHLILHLHNARSYLNYIQNAGSVFLGYWTPESAGDYVTGTNHVLPTYGYAKSYSGLSVTDFQKFITIQEITINSLKYLSSSISVLSQIEGLDAHNKAVSIRLESL